MERCEIPALPQSLVNHSCVTKRSAICPLLILIHLPHTHTHTHTPCVPGSSSPSHTFSFQAHLNIPIHTPSPSAMLTLKLFRHHLSPPFTPAVHLSFQFLSFIHSHILSLSAIFLSSSLLLLVFISRLFASLCESQL